jgi:[methyl-Co(III) methanol-specific corrinoid protein]:coenzyme M methyltransferase
MTAFSPKERLLRTLQKQEVDRPPIICSGGMMNAAVVDVMNQTGHTLPEAHHDDRLMAELSHDVHENTGFENLGIPFCMTVEAEVLGSEINFGSLACEPKIQTEVFPTVAQVQYKPINHLLESGRVRTIAQAGYRLSQQYPEIPVVGNLTGPVSTTASIVDPISFFKGLRKDPENAHKTLSYVTDFLIAYAQALIESGVTLITIGDPTATGEILGPKMFAEYAVPYLNRLINGIHALQAPVIVHICGDMNKVWNQIPEIQSDAISTDAMVSLKRLKEDFPQITTMGNVSTFLLEFGSPEKAAQRAEKLVQDGVNIISPACGLSTSSSLSNIQAMTIAVKENDHAYHSL